MFAQLNRLAVQIHQRQLIDGKLFHVEARKVFRIKAL